MQDDNRNAQTVAENVKMQTEKKILEIFP